MGLLVRSLRSLSVSLALLALGAGCDRAKAAVKKHEPAYARIDAFIKEATALAVAVPERGTRTFPACKPSDQYVFDAATGHNVDLVGGKFLAWSGSPLAKALAIREIAGKPGAKVDAYDLRALDKLDGIQHLVVIREHAKSDENHITADVFLVSRAPAKIVCAFPFVGAEPSYGSIGTAAKEIITTKRNGITISETERDIRVAAYEGSNAVSGSVTKLWSSLARHLGIAWGLGGDDFELAKKARAGQLAPPEGKRLSGWYLKEALDDVGIDSTRLDRTATPTGEETRWNSDGYPSETKGVSVTLFADVDKEAAVGPEHTVVVRGEKELQASLAAKPIASEAEAAARAKALGWTLAAPAVVKGAAAGEGGLPKFSKGYRKFTLTFKKRDATAGAVVLDYSQAARAGNTGAVRLEGRQVLIVSGESPHVGTAAEVAKVLSGK